MNSLNFSQNELLLFYLAVVILVVASFIAIRKKPRDPVRLNLSQSTNKKPVPRSQSQPPSNVRSAVRTNSSKESGDSRKEKALNAFFDFQGKSYDAFEVLDLPAGASIKAAQSAFNAQFLGAQGNQREILKAALEAIRKR